MKLPRTMCVTNMMGIIIAQCSFITNRNIIILNILKPKITVYVLRKLKNNVKNAAFERFDGLHQRPT